MHYQAVKSEQNRSRRVRGPSRLQVRISRLNQRKIRNRYSNEPSVCRFSFVRGSNESGKEKADAQEAKIMAKSGRGREVDENKKKRQKKKEQKKMRKEGRANGARASSVARS